MHRRKIGFFILAFIILGALSFFAMPYLRPSPDVVRPPNLESLDPAMAALIRTKADESEARSHDASAHGELGMVYEANLFWKEALACFETASRLEPDELSWRFHRAIALRQAGDFNSALELLRTLAERHPSAAFVQQRLGEALMEAGELAGAEIAFRRLIQLAPQAPQGYAGLGDVLLQKRDAPQAAQVLERAVSLAPDYRMAHYLLGRAYQQTGRQTEAERELERGVDARVWYLPDPLTAQVERYAVNLTSRLERAREYLDAGDARLAASILEEALASVEGPAPSTATNIKLLNDLAIAYLRLDRVKEAGDLLHKARELDKRQISTYINLTNWALRADRPDLMLEYADSAIALAPTLYQAHFAKGQALARQGRFEEALTSLEKAMQLDVTKPENHSFSGDICLRLKRYEKAIKHYKNAIELDRDMFPAWIGLAQANWQMGRRAEAERALAEARRIVPDHPMILRLERQFQSAP